MLDRKPPEVGSFDADLIVSPPQLAHRSQPHQRDIEKPPQHGEKPFSQVVEEAFDGPVLRLSRKLRLLEQAQTRNIRRGDALHVIAMTQRKLDQKHAVKRPTFVHRFAFHFVAFAALYVTIALAWWAMLSL